MQSLVAYGNLADSFLLSGYPGNKKRHLKRMNIILFQNVEVDSSGENAFLVKNKVRDCSGMEIRMLKI